MHLSLTNRVNQPQIRSSRENHHDVGLSGERTSNRSRSQRQELGRKLNLRRTSSHRAIPPIPDPWKQSGSISHPNSRRYHATKRSTSHYKHTFRCCRSITIPKHPIHDVRWRDVEAEYTPPTHRTRRVWRCPCCDGRSLQRSLQQRQLLALRVYANFRFG